MNSMPKEKLVKLGQFLLESHISSISPQIGTFLAEIRGQVKGAMTATQDPDLLTELDTYQKALGIVCGVSALHQGVVIAALKSAIETQTQEVEE